MPLAKSILRWKQILIAFLATMVLISIISVTYYLIVIPNEYHAISVLDQMGVNQSEKTSPKPYWLFALTGYELRRSVEFRSIEFQVKFKTIANPDGSFVPEDEAEEIKSEEQYTNNDLKVLKDIRRLDWLAIHSPVASNDCIEYFSHLKRLVHLDMRGTMIDDDGIRMISELENLEYLDIGETQVSDRCVDYLLRLRKLMYLDVTNTRITSEGCSKLEKGFPNIQLESGTIPTD